MDNKELLLIADAVSKEKNISKEDVLHALAEGMETSLRKDFPEGAIVSVSINPQTGNIKAYRVFEIVEEISDPEAQMLKDEIEDEIVEDGYAYDEFDFVMNRQKFNITKQVALQKIKQNSREQQVRELLSQPVMLYNGTVKVARKDALIVDCKGVEITIPRKNLMPRDRYRVSDNISFTLVKEKNQYFGVRNNEDYLREVLKREVHEISNGDIEIVSVARNPSVRSKVVLKSNVKNIDPIKTCIGYRGANIKQIQTMLDGEFIDLIPAQEDDVQLLIKAMQPISVLSVMVDEDLRTMDIAVSEEDINRAVGKNGKNIEMIQTLIGWNVNVFTEKEWENRKSVDAEKAISTFEKALNCDTELAEILWMGGFSSLEEIAYIPVHEFEIDELDEDTILALKENAKRALANTEELKITTGMEELIELGFSKEEREALQENEIINNSNVADLATWELLDIFEDMQENKAQEIIMKAREKDERFQDH